jgi:hypothetical protein
MSSSRTPSTIASAHRIARAGPSKEAVACRVHLAASEPLQVAPHHRVMLLEEIPPPAIADP